MAPELHHSSGGNLDAWLVELHLLLPAWCVASADHKPSTQLLSCALLLTPPSSRSEGAGRPAPAPAHEVLAARNLLQLEARELWGTLLHVRSQADDGGLLTLHSFLSLEMKRKHFGIPHLRMYNSGGREVHLDTAGMSRLLERLTRMEAGQALPADLASWGVKQRHPGVDLTPAPPAMPAQAPSSAPARTVQPHIMAGNPASVEVCGDPGSGAMGANSEGGVGPGARQAGQAGYAAQAAVEEAQAAPPTCTGAGPQAEVRGGQSGGAAGCVEGGTAQGTAQVSTGDTLKAAHAQAWPPALPLGPPPVTRSGALLHYVTPLEPALPWLGMLPTAAAAVAAAQAQGGFASPMWVPVAGQQVAPGNDTSLLRSTNLMLQLQKESAGPGVSGTPSTPPSTPPAPPNQEAAHSSPAAQASVISLLLSPSAEPGQDAGLPCMLRPQVWQRLMGLGVSDLQQVVRCAVTAPAGTAAAGTV